MLRKLNEFFHITGYRKTFIILIMLRCPFEAFRTIIHACFLQYSFAAIESKNTNHLYIICGLFGIGSLLLFLYNGVVWMTYAKFTIRLIRVLREKMFQHVSGISLADMDDKSSGEWFTRMNSDVVGATGLLNQPLQLPHAAVAIVGLMVSSSIILYINPRIFILVILFVLPHILISQLLIAKPITKLSKQSLEVTAENTFYLNSMITCADVAFLYDAKDFMLKQFEESSKSILKANMRIRKRSALGDALLPMLGMSGYLTILLLGGAWIMNGDLSFSQLLALFQYRGGVLLCAMMLTNCVISIKTSLASVERVIETMKISLEE